MINFAKLKFVIMSYDFNSMDVAKYYICSDELRALQLLAIKIIRDQN